MHFQASYKVEMVEKENIKIYMLHDIKEETVFMECIKNELAILLFTALVFVFSMKNIVFIILGILPSIVYLITVLSLHEEGTVKGISNILHNGIFALCASCIFAVLSLELVFRLFEEGERGLVIGMIVLGDIVTILLFRHIVKKNIEKNVFAGEKEKVRGIPAVAAFLGMIAGKVFLKNEDERIGMKVACIISLLISFVFLTGVFEISKYKYLVKHKELLEGLDEDIKE